MIITGLLSLLQILFVPGLILNAFIKKEVGAIYRLSFIIAFSLLFNFLYVIILVTINTYFFSVVLSILLIEIALIIFLYRKRFSQPISNSLISLSTNTKNAFTHYFGIGSGKRVSQRIIQIIKVIALLLALLTLGWVLLEFINQIGTVFGKWDSVVSYNRWANEWSQGIFPTGACEYPQLLPSNWSLTYVFTKSSIVIFAKLVQSVFPILFVLAMVDLGLTFGSAGLLFGVPISIVLLKKFAGVSLFEGYMDVAVTTFTLLSFYMVLKDLNRNSYSRRTLWFSGIVILAAALTKQPGALAFGAWVLINLFLLLSKNPGKLWPSIKKMAVPTLVFLFLMAAWYLFKMNRDMIIGERSCLAITNSWAVNDLNSGFWNILLYRFKLLDIWICLIPILIISVFFAKGGFKLILLCFGIPYLFVSISYGLPEAFIRYLTPISFIFVFSASILIDQIIQILLHIINLIPIDKLKACVSNLFKYLSNLVNRVSRLTFWWVLILGLMVFVLIGLKYPDSKLIRNYQIQQMEIGNRVINEYLVDFYKDKDSKDLTLTWYPFVNYLPGLDGRAVNVFGGKIDSVAEYLKQEDIHYILQYNATPEEISEYLKEELEKGQIIFITDFGVKNDAVLYEVVRN